MMSCILTLGFVICKLKVFLSAVYLLLQSLAEFELRAVRYEIKSPRCHELCVIKPPHDTLTFTFRSEQEAQEWATVMISSLREAHRGQSSLSVKFRLFLIY